MADLLGSAGVTVRPSPTNAESCAFDGPGGASVVVGLRAGDEVEPFWKLALDLNGHTMAPIAGVGDAAMRSADSGEVLARKGGLSCQVDLIGIDTVLGRPAIRRDREVLAGKLAGLCAKIFAARQA